MRFQVGQIEAADQHQELAGNAEKHTHVQQAAQHDHHAGRPANAGTISLSNSSGMVITPAWRSGLTQKPVVPTKNIASVEDAGRCAGKAVLVAILGRIHAGDDAELGGGQRGDSQVDVHFSAGHQEMFHLADVLTNHDAGHHGDQQIDATMPPSIGHEKWFIGSCLD